MTLTACHLLIFSVWITTITRPLYAELNVTLIIIGVIEGCLAIALYAAIRQRWLSQYGTTIVAAAMPSFFLPVTMLSGGIHSPIVFMMMILPFYTTVVKGPLFSWCTTLVVCICLVLMAWFNDHLLNLSSIVIEENNTLVRTYWAIMTLLAAGVFSSSFNKLTEALSETLREEATMDFLTRILNRRGLERILEREFHNAKRRNQWLTLILVDIDNFKLFNDTHGHSAGDEVLIHTAKVLSDSCRRTKHHVGRWGGEEFLVILPNADPFEARHIGESLRIEIESSGGSRLKSRKVITSTLGCCSAKGRDADIEKMLRIADKALYAGKARGKNRIVAAGINEEHRFVRQSS